MPVLFVATGIRLFPGHVGALRRVRLVGGTPGTALRVGILLNTRGLAELVVLQTGLSAGLLTSHLFLALVVMALATTMTTRLSYSLVDRVAAHRESAQSTGRFPGKGGFADAQATS